MASPVGRALRAYQLPLKVPSVGDYRRIGEPIRRLRRLSIGGRTGNRPWAALDGRRRCRLFDAGRFFVRSTQIVMHHFAQPERQVRHAVRCRDYFQDRQLRNWRQRVRCE